MFSNSLLRLVEPAADAAADGDAEAAGDGVVVRSTDEGTESSLLPFVDILGMMVMELRS